MNDLQDRLLRDLQAQAEHITPASVPPLRLPAPARRTRARWSRGPRRFPAWVTPLAAAVAVSVVLVGIFTAVQAVHHTAPVTASGPDGLPPYYVYLPRDWHSSAVVAKTATGAVVATLHAPHPYTFEDDNSGDCPQSISAAGDRQFVLMATGTPPRAAPGTRPAALRGNGPPIRLFRLQITPDGGTRLTALRLPEQLGNDQNVCYALSPDGTHLALAYTPNVAHSETMVIQVITLATGQVRQWSYASTLRADPVRDLTWVTPRTLAYYIPLNAPDAPTTTTPPRQDTPGTWLLDTTAPGPGLLAGSRRLTGELFEVQSATPDGAKLIGNHYREPGPHATATLEEISARTGKIIQTFGQCAGTCGGGAEAVLWSDPSGHQLVVARSVKNPPPGLQTDVIGILKPGGTFTPLRPQPKAEGQIPGLTW